jgi:hypothetical protein
LTLIVPGLVTALGRVALLLFQPPSTLALDSLLGFTAGLLLGRDRVQPSCPGARAGHSR